MIRLGQEAPDFTASAYQKGLADDYKNISLSDYKGKWVVLFFYPRDFTFVCPTEIEGFAKHSAEFEKANCAVLAVSTDTIQSHKAWFERDLKNVEYPILEDPSHRISRAYEVLDEENGQAERGTFIIDPEGTIRYFVVSDGNVGRSIPETLRVVQALQVGGLCPVDWHPGEKLLTAK
ncbi:peroxiredoxin [Candidatus Saccharibacteria bacterium]|nr:peroxiredoxin [Candidatus Saccharibacteria bacterium]